MSILYRAHMTTCDIFVTETMDLPLFVIYHERTVGARAITTTTPQPSKPERSNVSYCLRQIQAWWQYLPGRTYTHGALVVGKMNDNYIQVYEMTVIQHKIRIIQTASQPYCTLQKSNFVKIASLLRQPHTKQYRQTIGVNICVATFLLPANGLKLQENVIKLLIKMCKCGKSANRALNWDKRMYVGKKNHVPMYYFEVHVVSILRTNS